MTNSNRCFLYHFPEVSLDHIKSKNDISTLLLVASKQQQKVYTKLFPNYLQIHFKLSIHVFTQPQTLWYRNNRQVVSVFLMRKKCDICTIIYFISPCMWRLLLSLVMWDWNFLRFLLTLTWSMALKRGHLENFGIILYRWINKIES